MEENAGYYKVFGSAASVIGVIFSIFYICFSSFAIATYENANYIPDSYNVPNFIYLLFLRNCENLCLGDLNINSRTFNGFMYFYLISHIVWLFANGTYLYVIIRSKWTFFKNVLLLWTANTAIILMVELVLMSLLADDFKSIKNIINIPNFHFDGSVVDTSYVLMFGLVTQFYLFWIVNFVFVSINIYKIFNKSTPRHHSIIYAYGSRNAPPFAEIYNNPANNAFTNPAYVKETNAFNRSQSFEAISNANKIPNDPLDGNSNYFNVESLNSNDSSLRNRPNNNNSSSFLYGPQNNNRSFTPPGNEPKTATIGRRQGRNITPPLKVPSPNPPYPFIPPPDYTPPNSPVPKSILRSDRKSVV